MATTPDYHLQLRQSFITADGSVTRLLCDFPFCQDHRFRHGLELRSYGQGAPKNQIRSSARGSISFERPNSMQKEVSGTELLASRFARVEGFAPCFSRFLVSDDCILQVQEGPLDEATRRLLMVSKQMNELDLKRDERGNTLRDLAISGKAVLVWKLGAVSRRPFLKTVGRSFWERVPELVGESD